MIDVDVVIIGAGAAGLTAAISAKLRGASVMILEKNKRLGGSGAISGGIIWVPNNHLMAEKGIDDTAEDALAYFKSLDNGDVNYDLLETFVSKSPDVIKTLIDIDALAVSIMDGYPDYYVDRPGAKVNGGRAMDNDLFSFHELGEWADKIYTSPDIPRLMLRETPLGGASGLIDPEELAHRLENDQRGWGQAMIARLLKTCLAHEIEPRLNIEVKSMTPLDKGWGINVLSEAGREDIRAGSVIIATGGFEWNASLRQSFLRGPLTKPASPPTNQGDGLKLIMSAGASLGNMTSAWWVPTLSIPGDHWDDGSQRSLPVLIERTLPHTLMVNKNGERFCNEANNYSALAGAFQFFDPKTYSYPNLPAILVFDHQYRSKYPIATLMPGMDTPNWLTQASSLSELAEKMGVKADVFEETVNTFNKNARAGQDPEFGRGDSSYDRFYGDRSREGVLATLGEISQPPFYAVTLEMGALGTNGGAQTNGKAEVLDVNGNVIPGLFAAGNVMAGSTGGIYAGAGGTLGPALTFGFIAGEAAANKVL